MQIYHYRTLLHAFNMQHYLKMYQSFLTTSHSNESCDILSISYMRNHSLFQSEHITNMAQLLTQHQTELQYRRKLARLIHHAVLNNNLEFHTQLEQFLINCQQLSIQKVMQHDNLIELLDFYNSQIKQLSPIPKHIQRIYFEEDCRI